jgi:periplasmic protein TonB
MDPDKILKADILEIIFDRRNKEYGAFDLRNTYNSRLRNALLGTTSICILLYLGLLLSNIQTSNSKPVVELQGVVQLEEVHQAKDESSPSLPKVKPPKIEMSKYTPLIIVKDEEVKKEDKPPEVEKLLGTKISNVNQSGFKDEGIISPPASDNHGVVEAPKDKVDDGRTFTKVEIESSYAGGEAAWVRYLSKNLHYPDDAANTGVQGDVVVQFIVDKEGNVSDVEAVSGPDQLRDEAVRVIKKSGKWTPAVQNGRQVKSYKKQPIKFRLEAQ